LTKFTIQNQLVLKFLLVLFFCFSATWGFSQTESKGGIITGNLVNENNKRPVVAATVKAANVTDSSIPAITIISDENGDFTFSLLP
jgi:hypothetical protein